MKDRMKGLYGALERTTGTVKNKISNEFKEHFESKDVVVVENHIPDCDFIEIDENVSNLSVETKKVDIKDLCLWMHREDCLQDILDNHYHEILNEVIDDIFDLDEDDDGYEILFVITEKLKEIILDIYSLTNTFRSYACEELKNNLATIEVLTYCLSKVLIELRSDYDIINDEQSSSEKVLQSVVCYLGGIYGKASEFDDTLADKIDGDILFETLSGYIICYKLSGNNEQYDIFLSRLFWTNVSDIYKDNILEIKYEMTKRRLRMPKDNAYDLFVNVYAKNELAEFKYQFDHTIDNAVSQLKELRDMLIALEGD
ncbi:hypothetical protein [Photobacterium piscicola]|uniref:hypothetical protein n=1 Tax=Photobacterium piscicola TaxID=1378299 RepID=UPI0038D0FE09